jgi:hypothetical protein
LRAFDQRYGLTGGLAELVPDSREDERIRHSVLALFRQRAELPLKTILEVRKDDLQTVGAAPTRTQTCPTSAMGFLRYDFSF